MSDADEFVDDLGIGDTTLDDNYNLGNEEEELLLAGGSITEAVSNNQIDVPAMGNIHVDVPLSEHRSTSTPALRSNPIIDDDDDDDDESLDESDVKIEEPVAIPLDPTPEEIPAAIKPPDEEPGPSNPTENPTATDESNPTAKVQPAQRYREDHTERFPTERSGGSGSNQPNIPDLLDVVVAPDRGNGQFNVRKHFNNRGRRGPGNFNGGPNYNQNKNFDSFRKGDAENKRYNIDSFRPITRDARFSVDFRTVSYETPFSRFVNAGNANVRHRPVENFANDIHLDDLHPTDHKCDGNHNVRPNNMKISVNCAGPSDQPDNNFNNDMRPSGEPFKLPGNQAFGDRPPFIHRLNNKTRNDNNPPLMNFPGNAPNIPPLIPPPFHPRNNAHIPPMNNRPPPFDQPTRSNDNFKNLPPMVQESKKVLINPHFKGPVTAQNIVLQQSHLNMNRNIHNPAIPGGAPYNMHDGYLRNKPEQGNVSERELERMAQQFIEEQQRCLKRAAAVADDDYYEKTQRFIDSTSIDVRNSIDANNDERKEYLKRKQEEFINENRLNLQRRRNGSPMRSGHRSPPGNRYRNSPYRRNRPRTSHSPPQQTKREPSGEPEDKDYRAKLREQAEMRAKVLQAKERRRRRDAANLTEKMNNKLSPTPLEDKIEPSSTSTAPKKSDDETPSQVSDNVELSVNPQKDPKPTATQSVSPKIQEDTKNATNNKTTESEPMETLDDMLEDDLLRLSPEEEDLLLSDDDDTTTLKIGSSKSAPPLSTKFSNKNEKTMIKTSTQINNSKLNNLSTKRSNNDNKEDLRKKLTKTSETASVPPTSTVTSRKKIVFSNDDKESTKTKSTDNKDKTNRDTERTGTNKWRSTFSEQKLDLTAPVAARAMSAVMRNTSETKNRKVMVPKNTKPIQLSGSKENDKLTSLSSNGNASDDKGRSGRSAVVNNRRVVMPPRPQKPLVIVENEEDEPEQPCDDADRSKISKKTTANVSGLPPGMTEARLLSLCGPDVERVNVDGAGNADVNFNSIGACQRFVRRFNGRLVAACRLSVTVASAAN